MDRLAVRQPRPFRFFMKKPADHPESEGAGQADEEFDCDHAERQAEQGEARRNEQPAAQQNRADREKGLDDGQDVLQRNIAPGDGINRKRAEAHDPGGGDEGEKPNQLLQVDGIGNPLEPKKKRSGVSQQEDHHIQGHLAEAGLEELVRIHDLMPSA